MRTVLIQNRSVDPHGIEFCPTLGVIIISCGLRGLSERLGAINPTNGESEVICGDTNNSIHPNDGQLEGKPQGIHLSARDHCFYIASEAHLIRKLTLPPAFFHSAASL